MKVSILKSAIALLFGLAAVGCDTSILKRSLTVDEFVRQIDQLHGERVTVTGYLGECHAFYCVLYRNKGEAHEADRAIAAMRAALEDGADISGFPTPDHPSVSIGPGSESTIFDLGVQSYVNGYVVITGEAINQCRSNNVNCVNGGGDIELISVDSASAPS